MAFSHTAMIFLYAVRRLRRLAYSESASTRLTTLRQALSRSRAAETSWGCLRMVLISLRDKYCRALYWARVTLTVFMAPPPRGFGTVPCSPGRPPKAAIGVVPG